MRLSWSILALAALTTGCEQEISLGDPPTEALSRKVYEFPEPIAFGVTHTAWLELGGCDELSCPFDFRSRGGRATGVLVLHEPEPEPEPSDSEKPRRQPTELGFQCSSNSFAAQAARCDGAGPCGSIPDFKLDSSTGALTVSSDCGDSTSLPPEQATGSIGMGG